MDAKDALALCMWHQETVTCLEKQLAAARAGESAAMAKVKVLQHRSLQQQERCDELDQKVQQLMADLQASQSELASVLSHRSVKEMLPPRPSRVLGMPSGAERRHLDEPAAGPEHWHLDDPAEVLKHFTTVDWDGDALKAARFSLRFKNFVEEEESRVPGSDLESDLEFYTVPKTAMDYTDLDWSTAPLPTLLGMLKEHVLQGATPLPTLLGMLQEHVLQGPSQEDIPWKRTSARRRTRA